MASLKLRGLARLKAHTLNFHDRKVMASLKRGFKGLRIGDHRDFHDRKVMASLKRLTLGSQRRVDRHFHDRKVMASLKPNVERRHRLERCISMIERSWPH